MTVASPLRFLHFTVLCLTLLVAVPAAAQVPGLPGTGTAGDGQAVTGDLEQLVKTLDDPQRRDQLIQDLKSLLELQRKAREAEKADSVGVHIGDMVVGHSERVGAVFQRFVDWLGTFDQLPGWLEKQVQDPRRRAFWIDVGTVVGLTLVAVFVGRWVVGLALRRPIDRLRNSNPKSLQSRVFLAVALALLEAFIVAATIASGYATLVLLSGRNEIEAGALVLVLAWAIQTGVGVVARFVLAPYAEHLRLIPMRSETAAYLYVWVMRLTTVVAIGFVGSRLAIPFGAGAVGARGIEIAAALVFAVLLVVLAMQSREDFAVVIRGPAEQMGSGVRRRLADVWHVLAMLYILVAFGIFVSGEQDGFVFLVRATVTTATSFAAAYLLARGARRLIERLFRVDDELNRRFPGLRQRAGLYRPVLIRSIDVVLLVLAAGVSLGAWGLDLYTALGPDARARMLQSTVVIALVLVIGVGVWEFASGAIQRSLSSTYPDGTPRQPGGRAKTLLPLLRRVISIALVVLVGLIVLSEIGVDTAPLLAGAGVVGLAIGFGSQALVRDIITGLFILIEDTVSVGDVVTAGGHTGVVEDISIRTLRLRDVEGAVHTVPFGDVTSVVNMTKDFSYALMDIGVAYREDTDHVSALIREVGEELRQDPEHGPKILEPIEMLGVDQLADSAVVIRARLKTKPILQWGIKREMNRRLKKRFDAEGIEIPFPHQTLYFGVDKDGTAPPGRILLEAERAAARLKQPEPVVHPEVETVSAEEKDAARAEQEAAEQEKREQEDKKGG
ncbi:MAG: mechanosensitive ion channel [Thalassobaculum sp.]|uniref:mechanosensitive ion channel domain-containing protein n=1 Tax=Thalassobaculum sp. TaxID=2022740 RepID=UPI0032EADF87